MPYTVLGVSFFILWKFQVQLIIFVHTDDGGVEALLFAVKRLITAVCVSCRKMRQKVLRVYVVSDYVYMDINNPILIRLRQYSD